MPPKVIGGPKKTQKNKHITGNIIADTLRSLSRSRLGMSNSMRRAIGAQPKPKRKYQKRVKQAQLSKGRQGLISGTGTMSHFSYNRPFKMYQPTLSKLSARNNWISNYADRLVYADGRQNVYQMLYYDAVPLIGQLAALPAQNPVGNTSRRFFLDGHSAEFTFSNAGTATAYCYIYDIMYVRDMESAATDGEVFTPGAAWNTGDIEQGNALGYTMIGSYPTKVDKFNQFYKVLGKSTHFLRPGDIQKHKVSIHLNKFISENLITEKQRYAGITFATMLVAHGVPVDNDGDPPVITTSSGQIDITMTERDTFRWMQDVDYDTVVGSVFATDVSGLEVVQDTGVVTNVSTA